MNHITLQLSVLDEQDQSSYLTLLISYQLKVVLAILLCLLRYEYFLITAWALSI